MTTLPTDQLTITDSTPPQPATAVEGTNCFPTEGSEVKLQSLSEYPESQQVYFIDKLEYFRSAIPDFGKSAQKSYGKALVSLESFMRAFSLQYESLSTTLLADWLVSLSLSGHSLSTLQLYLNAISAISGEIDKDGSEEAGNVDFTRLRSILKEIIEEVATGESAANRKITLKSSENSPVKPAILRALHLTAVIAGGITIESAARLRREDLAGLPESVREITAPFEDPRRRYLFPLEQSDYTPRQLARRLASAFATAADPSIRRLPSPAEHWLRNALSLGATPSEAIGALGRNPMPGNPIIRLLGDIPPAGEEQRERLMTLVTEALTDNPLRWYALRLRQGVTPEELTTRIKGNEAISKLIGVTTDFKLNTAESRIFYPTQRVAHRTSAGIHHTIEPLLPGILFMRLRSTELLPLLREIGDIAWIYRDPASRESGYAAIPDRQMNAFQLAIGVFTEETRVAPLGTIAPRPGQKVIILGGPLAGHTATFIKTRPSKKKGDLPTEDIETADTLPLDRVLYRLTLPGLNGIEWEADLDPRLLELIGN